MLNKEKNNKGFTLVELLVVIAIIGILAVVAVPALFKNIEKGKVAELESDISAIRSAALSYYADKGTYPNEIVAGTGANSSELMKEIESLSKFLNQKEHLVNGNFEITEIREATLTMPKIVTIKLKKGERA